MSSWDEPKDNKDQGIDDMESMEDISYEQFEDNYDGDDEDDDYYTSFVDLNHKRGLSERSKSSSKKSEPSTGNGRLYMNSNDPLEKRVDRFINVELGALHPMDIILTSVDLIQEAGKRRSFEGMKYAHDIMDRIIEEKRHFNSQRSSQGTPPAYTIVIRGRAFETLMYGWANLCRKVPVATQRMREVLDLMIQESEYDEALKVERRNDGFPIPEATSLRGKKDITSIDPALIFPTLNCQPTVSTYNTLLNGLAQASYRSISSANEAEDVLRLMERLHRGKGWHVKPNTKSFMSVIAAFSRTKHPSAGERAEGVLRRMIRYHEEQRDVYSEGNRMDDQIPQTTERTQKIVTPDTTAYTAVMQAYGESNAPNSAEKTLALLTEVLESSSPHLQPDAFIFATTVNSFAKRAAKVTSPSARLEAAEAAESILSLMLEVLENREIHGDLVVPFNNCIMAWSGANLRESPSRAEAILRKMLETGGPIYPTTVTFNTCLQVWARAARQDPEAPLSAEELLQLMEQIDDLEPDIRSYTTLIGAYAKSNRPDKAFHARRVLEILLANLNTMSTKDSLSAVPFTAVLNAIAFTGPPNASRNPKGENSGSNKDDPFGVENDEVTTDDDPYMLALKTYDEVVHDLYELSLSPDHMFFASMIDVIAAYTSSESIERRQRLERVFDDASSAGEVSSVLVQALVEACPSRSMLLGLLNVKSWPMDSVKELPREWTRKVPPHFKKIKQEVRTKSKPVEMRRKPPQQQGSKRQQPQRQQNQS